MLNRGPEACSNSKKAEPRIGQSSCRPTNDAGNQLLLPAAWGPWEKSLFSLVLGHFPTIQSFPFPSGQRMQLLAQEGKKMRGG